MAKSLITGGAGFVGSHLADRLLADGDEVVVIDNLSSGSRENLSPQARFYEMDIRDSKIAEVMAEERPDYVFHLAAQIDVRKSVEDPLEDADVNLKGTLNILRAAHDSRVRKVIFASTGGAIYGDTDTFPTPEARCEQPLSPYGIHKLAAEKSLFFYGKVKGLDYTILRMSNIYGPRQNTRGEAGVIAIFLSRLMNGAQPYINGNGNQTRDYVYVKDVTEAFVLAKNDTASKIFNIGTGIETNVNDIFDMLVEGMGMNMPKEYKEARPGEQWRSCLDATRAKEELSWEPKYAIEQGLRETIAWFAKAK